MIPCLGKVTDRSGWEGRFRSPPSLTKLCLRLNELICFDVATCQRSGMPKMDVLVCSCPNSLDFMLFWLGKSSPNLKADHSDCASDTWRVSRGSRLWTYLLKTPLSPLLLPHWENPPSVGYPNLQSATPHLLLLLSMKTGCLLHCYPHKGLL